MERFSRDGKVTKKSNYHSRAASESGADTYAAEMSLSERAR